jgi:hypothetical protein
MSNCYIKCQDEGASVELTSKSQGPGPMKIQGPCVVDMHLIGGVYLLRGIRYDKEALSEDIKPKYNIGDMLKWNDNYFLVQGLENYNYSTLAVATGSIFEMSFPYAHDHATLEA